MAKEFGSRADMISNKIDEVSRNSIWREHCEKELHMHKLNTNFFIADPKSSASLVQEGSNQRTFNNAASICLFQ
eukprot:CAMPEP_0114282790 /NCGR_PEP_ID=MMETSP0059-20121206/3746_1 /TAXON_ID=36894 /ORGANISM="Pyramimonas parkeae, Strain CCMP726" /LENGTH=73 /DNA_ID=CAMNT_0001403455 /DNA_START=207 /DNA_END=428 /DNA_ORIENTATION=-